MPDHEPYKPKPAKPIRWPFGCKFEPAIERKLDLALQALSLLITKVTKMAVDLSDLKAAVDASAAGEASAIALLNGLATKIDELVAASGNTVDPADLQALADGIKASTAGLAAAVAADARP